MTENDDQTTPITLELYERYIKTSSEVAFDGRYLPYEWGRLPKSLSMTWMAYREMFEEFSREIANCLNQFTNHVHRLKVWNVVYVTLTDDEKMEALLEFIDPLATLSLTLPYVVRSRLIFATAHLCHQANQAREEFPWKDDLIRDEKIWLDAADKYGSQWQHYGRLKGCIKGICDKSYQDATYDFRHAYNHRIPPHIAMGTSQLVKRKMNEKGVSYTFGGVAPLSLETIVTLSSDQCARGYAAFEAFQELIKEHENTILPQAAAR
jgi:hypothetical protein